MTAPGLFGAVVRSIGLYWLVYGLFYTCSAIAPAHGVSIVPYFVLGSVSMVVGLFLMLRADGFVAMCYRKPDRDDDDDVEP